MDGSFTARIACGLKIAVKTGDFHRAEITITEGQHRISATLATIPDLIFETEAAAEQHARRPAAQVLARPCSSSCRFVAISSAFARGSDFLRPLKQPFVRARVGCQVQIEDLVMAPQGGFVQVPPSDPLDQVRNGLGKSAADQLRRVAANNRERWNVSSDDRSSSGHGAISDGDSREHYDPVANPHIVTNGHPALLSMVRHLAREKTRVHVGRQVLGWMIPRIDGDPWCKLAIPTNPQRAHQDAFSPHRRRVSDRDIAGEAGPIVNRVVAIKCGAFPSEYVPANSDGVAGDVSGSGIDDAPYR